MCRKDVRAIKRRIVAKESLTAIAAEHHVGYMTIYKIATGKTWKTVKPCGRLIGERDYSAQRTVPLAQCEALALLKYRKRLSNRKIAKRLKVADTTIGRAIILGQIALGLRLHQHSIRGTLKAARLRMQLTDDDVEELIRGAKRRGATPDWLRQEVEGG